jgi:hypothetical protein
MSRRPTQKPGEKTVTRRGTKCITNMSPRTTKKLQAMNKRTKKLKRHSKTRYTQLRGLRPKQMAHRKAKELQNERWTTCNNEK